VDKRFLTAFVLPPKLEIAGFKLDALCFRHLLTLEVINSPFLIADGRVPCADDIVKVLKICSTPNWVEASKASFFEKLRLAKIYSDIEYQVYIITLLKKYFEESMSVPKVWIKSNPNETSQRKETIHRTITVCTILMVKFGFTEEQAWNMPIGRATWYLTSLANIEGVEVSVISTSEEEKHDEDLKVIEQIEKEAREEILKQKFKK